ncbi:MAG: T9SS type A sorting domain-containing protein [Vicingaceae bacterium]
MKKLLLNLGIALLTLTGLQAQQIYVDEDFNAGSLPTGWTNSAASGTVDWQFGYDGSSTEPNINRANNIDSTNFAYFDDDSLGFAGFADNRAVLTTPSFDNSLAGTTTLSFDYNFRDWISDDTLSAEVYDGSNWVQVFSTAGVDDCGRYAGTSGQTGSQNCNNGFPSASIDISFYANANCQVRFIYDDGDDQAWYAGIDNVVISAPVDDDIRVAQIVDPLMVACGLDSNHLPIIKIKNEGTTNATNFDITFDVDNGTQSVTETILDTIAGGDSLLYQFTNSVNLSATTNYNILVYSTWIADGVNTNDTIRQVVSNEPSFSAPYVESFEVSPSDWVASGTRSSWDLGFPSGNVISFAQDGNNAWVTNLFGIYNHGERSYLTSPCFDFSAALGDPNVTFYLYRHSDTRDDSLVLQTSIDNGATWQTVPNTVIERNWYNVETNGSFSWSGTSGGWVKAENILSGLAGEGQVKLRFKFWSDFDNRFYAVGAPFEGFGIDNFRIGFPKRVDLGIQRLNYPIVGQSPDCGYSNEVVSVRLENRGATALDTFLVSFRVDNQPVQTDTVFQTFDINTVMRYDFKKLANFTGNPTGNYTLNVWVTAPGDGSSSNDSLRNIAITSATPPLFTSPFLEDFDVNFLAGTDANNANSVISPRWVTANNSFNWRVANSNANTPGGAGPAADHTGNNGNFIYTEPRNVPAYTAGDIASISSPCLDFTTKDSLVLEFWYFGYGANYGTGLHVDIFDGTNWVEDVDVITSFPQVNANSPWSFERINLNQFAGKRLKFRFRFELPMGSTARSVIAIDDVAIYQPIAQDAEMVSINGPISNCALNANSQVEVTVDNFGLNIIPADSLTLVYRVIAGLDTQIVREPLGVDLIQRTPINYTFSTPADLSIPGREYVISAWTELNGDSNFNNDSVVDYLVTNFTRLPGYRENFTTFDFVDGSCLAPDFDQVGRGWTAGNTQYTWNLQNARICVGPNGATPTFGTGPLGDHSTTQANGKFFYTESTLGSQNDEATLTSPCLDFVGVSGAAMAFWYHKFGSSMGDLYIDVLADGIWTLGVDTVIGETQLIQSDAWQIKAVKLGQFANKLIQVRFRGVKRNSNDRGDMAIDDIELYEPIPQDARVSRVLSPVTECSPVSQVTVVVENFGTDSILPNTVTVNYNVNGGGTLSEILPVGIPVGGSVIYDFAAQGVFNSFNTTYRINSWTALQNDSNSFNDSTSYRFTNITQSIAYEENFESFTDGGCNVEPGDILTRGWRADPPAGGSFHWNVQNAGACGGTGNALTGPRTDATRGGGIFMYTTSTQPGSTADLYLPCISFENFTTAGMTFKYHMFGSTMGTLMVQVYNDITAQWDTVYTISGQQQTSKFDPWREAAAKFEEFRNQEVEIRFRAIKGGSRSQIAIDDIGFYLPQPIDARVNAVVAPVEGCEIFEQSIVAIEIENFGTKSIAHDSLEVYYQVDNRAPVRESFVNQTNPADDSLLTDEVATYFFNTTTDLSTLGARYNIKAWTSAKGEGNVDNDTLFEYVIFNETKRTNYFEDMETFKDASCVAALGQVLTNGWKVASTNGYTWHVQSGLCRDGDKATFTVGTGPYGDHTTGNGIFLYTESGNNNPNGEAGVQGTAIFESPCIDLQPNTNVRLSFWYHRFGPNLGDLFVDVFSGGTWSTGETISVNGVSSTSITSETQSSSKDDWTRAIVDLDAYAGERVLIRFRAVSKTSFRGDIAIDDILLYEPSDTDIAVTEIIDPEADFCVVGNSYNVRVRLENVGLNRIDSGIILTYTNGTSTSTDTLSQGINAGQNIVYTFSTPFDLTLRSGVQNFRVTAKLAGDTITKNNSIFKELNNRQPSLPRYFMDFENHSPGDLQGWRNTPAAGYSWGVVCGPGPDIDGMMPNPPVPAPPSGPSGDHTFANTLQNGKGCYMHLNSNIVPIPLTLPDALLELPCGEIDFSTSFSDRILMTFWYHMYGANMGDLYVDVHDGTAWRNRVDVIRGTAGQVNDDTERWKRKQVVLDQFAGLPKVKIRFRAEWNTRGGNMGIDDVEILDRVPNDASIVKIIDPESDCELTNTERFRVQFQNVGTDDILESVLGYQLTFTPYKGNPMVMPIVRDTVVGTNGFVAPLAFQTFEFDRIDMSEPGTYEFKIWTEIAGDVHYFNDTIVETVVHETRPFPNCEDFSDMVFGQIPKDYRDGKLPNGWVGTTAAYAFKASIGGGGPAVGHTGRSNDAFLLLDDADGLPGQQASITSPCYDLTNTPAAILEFWYQAPSEGHTMFIETRNTGGQWEMRDTLRPQGGAGGAYQWTKYTLVMTNHVGGFAQVRFTGINAGGFYAIDDFCMLAPPRQQVEFERFITPQTGLCFYSNQEVVTMRLENIGLDRIDSVTIVLAVDSAIQNFPVGQYLRDTTTVYFPRNPFFDPGVKVDVQLNLPSFLIDMSGRTNFYLSAYVILPGDRDLSNNEIEDYRIFHPTPIALPFVEDFEFIRGEGVSGNYTNGIQQFVGGSGFYTWSTQVGPAPKADVTGPISDHTKGKPDEGVYMLTNSDLLQLGDIAVLQTRCIDLSQAINPEVKYWYYMFGTDVGELYLEINDDSGWERIDALVGQDRDQNFSPALPWKSRTISLLPYAGKFVKLRFWSVRGDGPIGDIAIDDLSVYDLAAKDLTPISLAEPNDDTTSCYTENQNVRVNIRNNGSDSINFTRDSSFVQVVIFKENSSGTFVQIDSMAQWVTENLWEDFNGDFKPVPTDSIVTVTMDSTFDMSDTGKVYRFVVNVSTTGDVITRKDQYTVKVLSQWVGGEVYRAIPNDTVCFGDQVRLRLRNHFGGVRWEEKVATRSGNDNWSLALNFPFDSAYYITIPDSTTTYRVRICNTGVISDSFEVAVIKPFVPTGIDASRCDVGFMTIRADVENNITGVRMYDSLNGGNIIADRNVPFGYSAEYFAPDTFFLEGIIKTNNVIQGFCASIDRDTVFATVNYLPEPPLIDSSIPVLTDSLELNKCLGKVPGFLAGGVCRTDVNRLRVCKDTSIVLDGGRVEGRQDSYEWSIIMPDGSVINTSNASTDSVRLLQNQTLVVDAWLLEKNQVYGYTVMVTSDSGCVNKMPYDTAYVLVTDSCITSLKEAKGFKDGFDIYPNPAAEELNVKYSSVENFKGSIRLLTIEGQLVEAALDLNFSNLNYRFDLGDLPKGIYIIKVETERGSFVEKIIKS